MDESEVVVGARVRVVNPRIPILYAKNDIGTVVKVNGIRVTFDHWTDKNREHYPDGVPVYGEELYLMTGDGAYEGAGIIDSADNAYLAMGALMAMREASVIEADLIAETAGGELELIRNVLSFAQMVADKYAEESAKTGGNGVPVCWQYEVCEPFGRTLVTRFYAMGRDPLASHVRNEVVRALDMVVQDAYQ